MLTELRVRNLGVIDDLSLVLGAGMTALTGETGAGKTLVVEAIELLVGGKADSILVRPGADEATVEGRFGTSAAADNGDDLVIARTVPVVGRSRAYVAGRMASLAALAEAGADLVDLHGQHSHQSLLSGATQRAALDTAGKIDATAVVEARRRLRLLDEALAALGGDARGRARELDLLRYQLDELDGAALDDPGEDEALAADEDRLAGAVAHREAAGAVHAIIVGDEGPVDQVGVALSRLAGRGPLAAVHGRLRQIAAELADVASEARNLADRLEDDPERLALVTGRRQLLRDLRRKYGATLTEVIAERERIRARIDDLASHDERAAAIEGEQRAARDALVVAEEALGAARRAAAPALAAAVETQLRALAMPLARFEVCVGDDRAGESVSWQLSANPGEPTLPLAKVASGGELARTMLAARLVLSAATEAGGAPDGPEPAKTSSLLPRLPSRTLVFDEVDAGVGGEAARSVGRALAALARHHQVLVVTHLPQVAAFADSQVAVTKVTRNGRTVAVARPVAAAERVVELSRMLSGQPGSETARRHAEELLAMASGERAG